MTEEIIVDGIKLEAVKEIKNIWKVIPRTFEKRGLVENSEIVARKIVYSLNGKNNYEKFIHNKIYEINGKTFYRTEAFPPKWEFKFIEW